ncbi:DNA polymerase III subunit gamma and tau [Nocardioides sp.]|uniref:DNA polymerase III subunit gamma and tau n=1 Tax=Nocardioides sp. TaxID=35761 RepID=UPI0026083F5F|nr:DNA polymerase III subunit gamma and tau [Nocardioides sp.]
MDSPLALYRRYRPETFAEVIGQEHVTEPLRAALSNNRVNHAYLFSGPRGCGKTTSARILARALNCELAPVPDPCGECDSCRDLARNGPGSIDVIEIDAASHGGVDDARDLREKAFFAPVRSRYKVYIIDEAHMVTTQGFNALLKLVEEPPPHLRFIFATTEPDKVIPTIRSRTHHYPFRLIPPRLLSSYLTELCDKEGVTIEPAALPLVVRAGAGSARDTMSVLDQLLGGAGPEGVTHALASGLLGYTPDTLLDEVVDAFAAGDGSSVFGVVDKVIETGQDPRRFTEDLLRRLRDLVIVAAVPDAPATGLIDVSQDQGERLVAQASRFGRADLSRAADLVATGLTEMRGATAPRLLLELICARVLLPGADHTTQGVLARLDRIERRASITGTVAAPSAVPAPAASPVEPAPPVLPPEPVRVSVPQPAAAAASPAPAAEPEPAPAPAPGPAAPEPAQVRISSTPPAPAATTPVEVIPERPAAQEPGTQAPAPGPGAPPAPEPRAPAAASAPAASAGLSLVEVRRLWPDVIEATKQRRKMTWIHLTQNAQVVAVDGAVLTLGFANAGARDSFDAGGSAEIVRQAAIDVVGTAWRIETIIDPGASAGQAPPPQQEAAPVERAPAAAEQQSTPAAPGVPDQPPAPSWAAPDESQPPPPEAPPAWLSDDAPPPGETPGPPERPAPDPGGSSAARDAIRATRTTDEAPDSSRAEAMAAADADASPDDLDADSDQLGTDDLLARELGAQMIEEIPNE